MTVTMDGSLLFLRVVIGLLMMGHGAQKLFKYGKNPGFATMQQMFQKMGFVPGWLWLGLAVIGELGGGISLALGLLTPLGAAGVVGAMFMASSKHWKNGIWLTQGGSEYTIVLFAIGVVLGLVGPGAYSLDALFGIALPEVMLFTVLAIVALLVDVVGLIIAHNVTHANEKQGTPAHA